LEKDPNATFPAIEVPKEISLRYTRKRFTHHVTIQYLLNPVQSVPGDGIGLSNIAPIKAAKASRKHHYALFLR
jgi:hypothetical protein